MIYTGRLFHEDSQFQQASIVYPLPSRLTTGKRIRYDWYVSLLFCGLHKPTRCFFASKHDSTEPSSRSQKRLKGTGGTGSWQTGGCLVSGLMAKPALFLFAGVFLFIHNCISISMFISNWANLLIIRFFLPTVHLPWARSKASKKRKNTNLATSNLFLSIGICKLTGVGSQKKGMGLGVSLFKRLRGYQLCDFHKDHCVSVGASQNDFPIVPNFQWLEGRWDGLTKSIDWIRLGFLDLLLNSWYFSWRCFHNRPSLGSKWVKLQCATLEPPGCSDVSKCRRCKQYRGNYVNLLRKISS